MPRLSDRDERALQDIVAETGVMRLGERSFLSRILEPVGELLRAPIPIAYAINIATLLSVNPNPAFLAVMPAAGLGGMDQLRVLLCEEGTQLAWFGAFRPMTEPFGSREKMLLDRITGALLRRVRLERQLHSTRRGEVADRTQCTAGSAVDAHASRNRSARARDDGSLEPRHRREALLWRAHGRVTRHAPALEVRLREPLAARCAVLGRAALSKSKRNSSANRGPLAEAAARRSVAGRLPPSTARTSSPAPLLSERARRRVELERASRADRTLALLSDHHAGALPRTGEPHADLKGVRL